MQHFTMTATQIEQSIENEKLELNFWEKYDHYSLGWGLLFPAVLLVLLMIFKEGFDSFLFTMSLIFFTPAFLILFHYAEKRLILHKSKRKFSSNEEAYKEVVMTIKNLNWAILYENNTNYIQAYRYRKNIFERANEIRIFIRNGNVYSVSLYYPVMQAGIIEDQNPLNVFTFNKAIQNVA